MAAKRSREEQADGFVSLGSDDDGDDDDEDEAEDSLLDGESTAMANRFKPLAPMAMATPRTFFSPAAAAARGGAGARNGGKRAK